VTGWNPNIFLNEGEAKGFDPNYLKELEGVGRRLTANGLPVIFSLAHLAAHSRTLYADLHQYVARSRLGSNDTTYRNFTISKRSGGKRWISIPEPPLKAVQSWIAQEILNRVPVHEAAYAYVVGRRITKHATNHCAAEWLVKVDIKDFFGSISELQVYKAFESMMYPKLLSFEMARLCTRASHRRRGARWNIMSPEGIVGYQCRHIGSLPQGAPSSPALSNIVCEQLDKDLIQLAIRSSAQYSRYADDLCFSFHNSSRARCLEFKKEVSKVLWRHSFMENPDKTRIVPPGARKLVTGLIINGEWPTVPKEVRDVARAHLYYAKKFGIPKHCASKKFRSVIGFRNYLYGLIMYVQSVDAALGQRYFAAFQELPWLEFE